MRKAIKYLTLEQILLIHEFQIETYGGSHGLRDMTLLESAVFRPQTTFGGIDSLLLNHPFIDGNKRTAIASALIFLELNNYSFISLQNEIVTTALNIANKKWSINKISSWLKKYSKKIRLK